MGRDSSCWFVLGGKYKVRLVVDDKTASLTRDEAAVVQGQELPPTRRGDKTLAITKRGVCRITLVGQDQHDTPPVLVVK